MKELEKLFDLTGNCLTLGDPYRGYTNAASLIFDREGDVRSDVFEWLVKYVKKNQCHPLSDAAKIIWADRFASNTKGNYSAIYMWR